MDKLVDELQNGYMYNTCFMKYSFESFKKHPVIFEAFIPEEISRYYFRMTIFSLLYNVTIRQFRYINNTFPDVDLKSGFFEE